MVNKVESRATILGGIVSAGGTLYGDLRQDRDLIFPAQRGALFSQRLAGYDSFNLHGVSYGTRLALETLRRHPEVDIRSVVLDSPAAPSIDR